MSGIHTLGRAVRYTELLELTSNLEKVVDQLSHQDLQDKAVAACMVRLRKLAIRRTRKARATKQHSPLDAQIATKALRSALAKLRCEEDRRPCNPGASACEAEGIRLQDAADISVYCGENKLSSRIRAVAMSALRSPEYDDQVHKDVWTVNIYRKHESAALTLLAADDRICADSHVNGGRRRINALLFVYAVERQMAESDSIITHTLDTLESEIGCTRSKIQLLLRRGKWAAMWLHKFGFGGLFALGDNLSCGDNIAYEQLPALAKMCRGINGFEEKVAGLRHSEYHAVSQAMEICRLQFVDALHEGRQIPQMQDNAATSLDAQPALAHVPGVGHSAERQFPDAPLTDQLLLSQTRTNFTPQINVGGLEEPSDLASLMGGCAPAMLTGSVWAPAWNHSFNYWDLRSDLYNVQQDYPFQGP